MTELRSLIGNIPTIVSGLVYYMFRYNGREVLESVNRSSGSMLFRGMFVSRGIASHVEATNDLK